MNKCSQVVLSNNADYVKKMKELLIGRSKFKEIFVEPGKKINLLLQLEGKLIGTLKQDKTLLLRIYINTYIT